MSLTSHFPLFSSISHRIGEKLTSMDNKKSKIDFIEVIIAVSERKRSDIDHYYCAINYRPENEPTNNTCSYHAEFESEADLRDAIDYFNDTFTIMRLRTGVVFK